MNLALDPIAILSYAEEIGSDDLYAAAKRDRDNFDSSAHELGGYTPPLYVLFAVRKSQLERMIAWCEKIDRAIEQLAGDDEVAFERLVAQTGRRNAERCTAYNEWLKQVHFEMVG